MTNRFLNSSIDSVVKSLLLLLFILGFSQLCLAQKGQKLDSLLGVLQKVKDDTSKVNTLNALSVQLWRNSKYVDSRKYSEDALKIAKKLNYVKGIAEAFNNLGVIDFKQYKYNEALKNSLSVIKFSKETGVIKTIYKIIS